HTHFQLFTGLNTPFPTPGQIGPRIPGGFRNGMSNTFLIVEAADAVPWTKPADVEVRPDRPLPRLDGPVPGKFRVVFADASTREVSTAVPEEILRLLIDPKAPRLPPEDWER